MRDRDQSGATSLQTLDFLRGVAALYVLINHVRGTFFVGGRAMLDSGNTSVLDYAAIALLQLTTLGGEFVILFFVISGYAMAHSLRHQSSAARFYLKRVIRIWPPYLAAVALAAAVAFAVGNAEMTDPRRIGEVAFYIRPSTDLTPQFWSLPYEVAFYALCPLILVGPVRVRAFLIVAIVFTAAAVGWAGIAFNPFPSFILNFAGNEMLFFAAGAWAYHYREAIPGLGPWLLAAASATILAAVIVIKFMLGDMSLVTNLLMVALTLLLIRNLPPIRAFNLGFFSYSIYIFHFALVALAAHHTAGWFDRTSYAAWMLVVPAILGACWLLYLVTERPCNAALARMRSAEGREPETIYVRLQSEP